ncbi:Hypp4154 [Branchiostoma lanceolatum]|uniref:Hypp4154 protein n=1 Tax=Branchiostoma lanceolatum TaxID=7740 RepID=A0A8K0A670_BRALA|nr:Hypp4154 [Branchiostoma lanceolatum]
MLRLHATLVLAVLPATVLGLSADEIAAFQARTHIERNSGKQGTVSVTQDGDVLVLTSNGIPDHATSTFPSRGNPNDVREQSYTWRIPVTPTPASSPGCLGMGPIGMAVNGVPIFNPFNINCLDAVENEVLDACDGHPAQRGNYHYHHEANCLPDNAESDSGASGIVGVAFDGIAIYGPRKEDGTLYVHNDLDACHGITVNGTYRYHMTSDFPYFIGCYYGELLTNSGAMTRCECDVQTYLANSQSESTTVTSSAVTLAAGAATLTSSAVTLAAGAATVTSSAETLAVDAATVTSSAVTLAVGAATVTSSVETLAVGAATVTSSAVTLAVGAGLALSLRACWLFSFLPL